MLKQGHTRPSENRQIGCQVYQIETYADDDHKLNHVKYNIDSPGTQTDCPRFTTREDYAENWMTVTSQINAPVSATWTMPDTNQSEIGLMSKTVAPDGTEQRVYYHSSGWDKAVPILSETWGATKPGDSITLQRWATTHLTQDNTTVSFIQNPRVTSASIGDSGNVRKNGVSYTTYTLPSGTVMYLPNDSFEYNSDGTTVYRHAQTDYNFNSEYVNRYILGLPSESRLYAGSGTASLQAKTSYGYDEESLTNLPNIIQHDTANYGTGAQWRGNQTSSRRWNVINTSESTVNKVGYTIAGTPAWTQDPVQTTSNRVSVSYTDNFSDNVNRNSYAYPTTVTDPEGFTVTSKYHYLSGLTDEIQGPKAGQTSISVRGAISKTHYDSIDRVEKTETLYPNGTPTGAYVSYDYMPSMTEVKQYTKLDGSLAEAYSFAVLDGHGRTRAAASELPNAPSELPNSVAYSGRVMLYDNMGRNWKSSFPAETNASGGPSGWDTTGDDDAAGWLYSTESFDWKGRTLVLTNTDGTTKETLYQGCGCAGGQTVVTRDEVGRRQKVTFDNFGRAFKSQILQIQTKTETLNGNGEPYSTVVTILNTLDQTTSSKAYDGNSTSDYSCPTGNCQESTVQYDGFGRQWKTHVPQQDANGFTTTTYNSDGTIYEMQDARGTKRTFTYNYRKLPTLIHYTTTGNILNVGDVSFQYDAAGNRTSMDDEQGLSLYDYDSLSRMTGESRHYDSLGVSFDRTYTYNNAGQLTGVLDPNGGNVLNVTYAYDKTGRLADVGHGGYGNVNSIVDSLKYRAWGATKEVVYGNSLTSVSEYNSRLQMTAFELRRTANPNDKLIDQNYQFTTSPGGNDNDGNLKFAENTLNSKLNRTYTYDFANRMLSAKAGVVMISGSGAGRTNGPFEQSYSFDAFGSTTAMTDRRWIQSNGTVFPNTVSSGYAYQNGRRTYGNSYDADGLVTQTTEYGRIDFGYDSVGDLRYTGIYDGAYSLVKTNWTHFDGDGRKVKSTDWENNQTTNSYYFNSSVLGRLLFEVDGSGGFKKAYAYSPSGQLLARQESNGVTWVTGEAQGATTKETNSSGAVTGTNELDPLGRAVDSSGAYNYDGTNDYGVPAAGFYTPGSVPGVCGTTFGVSMSCGIVRGIVRGTGIHQRGLQERIADNGWSLSRLRPNGEFWDNLDRGYVMVPEFEYRRDTRTITYRQHWIRFLPAFKSDAERVEDCLSKSGMDVDYFKPKLLQSVTVPFEGEAMSVSAAAMLVLVGFQEKVSPALLAFTWQHETNLDLFPQPNDNGHPEGAMTLNDGEWSGWDVGPFGINVYWTGMDVAAGDYQILDLDDSSEGLVIYGSLIDPKKAFDGSPYANARVAARKLRTRGSGNRTRAVKYTSKAYEASRGANFDRWFPLWAKFFDCYRKR